MNDIQYEQLKEQLAFSEHALDEAVLHHSQLYFTVCEEYAIACSIRDDAKKNMEESYAQNSLRIRDQALEENKKLTEDLVKQLTLLDHDYKTACKNYLASKLEADLWGALKESYSTRGYMIREMAELWRSNYFATSSINQPNTTAGELQYEAAKSALAIKRREMKK